MKTKRNPDQQVILVLDSNQKFVFRITHYCPSTTAVPTELLRLIQRCREEGLFVIVDVVDRNSHVRYEDENTEQLTGRRDRMRDRRVRTKQRDEPQFKPGDDETEPVVTAPAPPAPEAPRPQVVRRKETDDPTSSGNGSPKDVPPRVGLHESEPNTGHVLPATDKQQPEQPQS